MPILAKPIADDIAGTITSVAQIVGSNLKSRRQALGYTQVDVARALKVDRSLLSQYESATIDIPLSRLAALSVLYSVPIERLFDNPTSGLDCPATTSRLAQTNEMRETVMQMRELLKTMDLQQIMGVAPNTDEAKTPPPISKTSK